MARKGIAQVKKKASKYRTPSISSDSSQESSRSSYKANGDAEEDDGALPIARNTRKKRNGSDNNDAEERENIDPSNANIARGILKLSRSASQPRPDLPARRPIRSSDLFSDDLPEDVSPAITRTIASPEEVVVAAQSPSPRTTAPPAPASAAPPSKRKRRSKNKAGNQTADAAPRKDSALTQDSTHPQDPAVPQDDAYLHHSAIAPGATIPLYEYTMSGQEHIHGGASIPANQHRNMRACMVCSIVRTQQQFLTQGCPNCESFLELAGSSDQINDCTSQVFEGLISVADTNRSWVAKYQRIEGYVPGVYATQVEGILPEDVLVAVENAGIAYVPRDGSEQEMLGKE